MSVGVKINGNTECVVAKKEQASETEKEAFHFLVEQKFLIENDFGQKRHIRTILSAWR